MSERIEGDRETAAADDAHAAARDAEPDAKPIDEVDSATPPDEVHEARPINEVDEASKDSFPASDPPPWEPLHTGTPGDHPDDQKRR